MLDWRTLVKTGAARDKLAGGDYSLVSSLRGLRETEDTTYIAFPASGGHALFSFHRGQDIEVFSAIDECASYQQQEWSAEAERFNSMPESERVALLSAHRQAVSNIQAMHDEISRSRRVGGDMSALLLEKRAAFSEQYAKMLPPYLVVPKVGNVVWARRSIGR